MARRKRTSPAAEQASTRSAALASIDEKLDLGNDMTLAGFDAAITSTNKLLADYNKKLSDVDEALNKLEQSEQDLIELSTRMLAAVGVKYGKDSDQYEKAGGTRTSERKSPERKAKVQARA